MSEKIISSMLDCYNIDDFFRRILLNNIKKNPGFVIDYMLDSTMSGHVSYIKSDKLIFVFNSLNELNDSKESLGFDPIKMHQIIARLSYYLNFLDYKA